MSGNNPPPTGGGLNSTKRKRPHPVNLSFFPSIHNSAPEGKFVLIKRTDGDKKCESINPFVFDRFLKSLFTKGYSFANRIRDIGHLFKVFNDEEAAKAIGKRSIDSPPGAASLDIVLFDKMNYSRGSFITDQFRFIENEIILNDLKEQNEITKPVEIARYPVYYNGAKTDKERFVVSFNTFKLPEKVKISYLHFFIRPYYDNPLRCTRCQLYGHTKNHCVSEKEICGICALDKPHEGLICGPPKCVNCKLPHTSNSRDCKVRQFEELVRRVQTEKRISPTQARREVEKMNRQATASQSFADVARDNEMSVHNNNSKSQEQITIEMYKRLCDDMKAVREMNEKLVSQMNSLQKETIELKNEIVDLKTENRDLKRKLAAKPGGVNQKKEKVDSIVTQNENESDDIMDVEQTKDNAIIQNDDSDDDLEANGLLTKIDFSNKDKYLNAKQLSEFSFLAQNEPANFFCWLDNANGRLILENRDEFSESDEI